MRYEEKSCDDAEVSSWNNYVCIGQFLVHASGLNTLVRSSGDVAQEIQEGMTTHQYNEVILALAILYSPLSTLLSKLFKVAKVLTLSPRLCLQFYQWSCLGFLNVI